MVIWILPSAIKNISFVEFNFQLMFITIINLPRARPLPQSFPRGLFPGKPCLLVTISKYSVAVIIFIKLLFIYNYKTLTTLILLYCELTSSSIVFEGWAFWSEVDWLGGLSTSKQCLITEKDNKIKKRCAGLNMIVVSLNINKYLVISMIYRDYEYIEFYLINQNGLTSSNKNVIRQHVMLGGFERLAPINARFGTTMCREASCVRMAAFVHGRPYF